MADEEQPTPKEGQEEQQQGEEDIYREDDVEKELEDDEISEGEAGFMEGYDRAEDKKEDDEDKD